MKNILAFAALFLCLSSFSQTKFSPLLGLNYSNLRVGNDPDTKEKFGYRVGFLISSRHLHLETVYTKKGVMENRNQDPSTGEFARDRWQFNLNYVQQSVMLNIPVGRFSMQAGGFGAYLTSATLYNTNWGVHKRFKKDDFRRWDYGFKGGIAYDLLGASIHLGYEHSLPFIADDHKPMGDHGTGHAFKNVDKNFSVTVPLGRQF